MIDLEYLCKKTKGDIYKDSNRDGIVNRRFNIVDCEIKYCIARKVIKNVLQIYVQNCSVALS